MNLVNTLSEEPPRPAYQAMPTYTVSMVQTPVRENYSFSLPTISWPKIAWYDWLLGGFVAGVIVTLGAIALVKVALS